MGDYTHKTSYFFEWQGRSKFKFIITQVQYLTYQEKGKRISMLNCKRVSINSFDYKILFGRYLDRFIIRSITANQLSKIVFNTENSSPQNK